MYSSFGFLTPRYVFVGYITVSADLEVFEVVYISVFYLCTGCMALFQQLQNAKLT